LPPMRAVASSDPDANRAVVEPCPI